MHKYVMEHLDVSQDAPKPNITSNLDVLKFIGYNDRSLKSTSSIATEDLEKAQLVIGWFRKNSINCTLAATTQISQKVLY